MSDSSSGADDDVDELFFDAEEGEYHDQDEVEQAEVHASAERTNHIAGAGADGLNSEVGVGKAGEGGEKEEDLEKEEDAAENSLSGTGHADQNLAKLTITTEQCEQPRQAAPALAAAAIVGNVDSRDGDSLVMPDSGSCSMSSSHQDDTSTDPKEHFDAREDSATMKQNIGTAPAGTGPFNPLNLSVFDESKETMETSDIKEDPAEVDAKKARLGFGSIMQQVKSQVKNAKSTFSKFTRMLDAQPKAPDADAVKGKCKRKNEQELSELRLVQRLTSHTGPIWSFAFSHSGKYLATGGQDSMVRVWAVVGSEAAAEMAGKQQSTNPASPASPASPESPGGTGLDHGGRCVLHPTPFRLYAGHKEDVIDLAWSKADFLLSASVDKTVRLWHVRREKCLCLFQHADFVTAVAFHPTEHSYFVSGCFDKKLRVWNIPEHRVVKWAQAANIITSATFTPGGDMVAAGLYDGRVVLYQLDPLKYFTQIECRNRGKYSKGRKVTGLQFSASGEHLLVTTNDSRVRLFNMADYSLAAKYKGLQNEELQIRAYFSEDGNYIVCGSQDEHVYMWNREYSYTSPINPALLPQKKQFRNDSYEYFRANANTVTCAQFMPKRAVELSAGGLPIPRHMLVTSGYGGELTVFENRGAARFV